jgi:calcineurin-like phosphoesterase family protein
MCQNVHIITGNHDHHIENNREDIQSLFSSVHKYLELNVKRSLGHAGVRESTFVLMHFPIASWNNMAKGTIHLHGHVHLDSRHRIGPGRMIDVGLEGNHLYPIDMVEILTIMDGRPIKGMLETDHHEIVENYK